MSHNLYPMHNLYGGCQWCARLQPDETCIVARQNQKILQHLMDGNTITPLDALQNYGCFRLAARISDLKNQGHAIVKVPKKVATRQNGMVTVAEYFLERPATSRYVNGL